jgi:ribonuclease G
MQSAFVDLGLERDCFLYVSDFFEENADEFDRVPDERRPQERSRTRSAAPPQEAPAPASEDTAPAEAGDRFDRRSRRTRRRRRSGRGLPESKFASLEEAAPPAPEAEPEPEPEAAADDLLLLPGESLAKYRRRHETSVSEAGTSELTEAELEEAAEEAAEQILDRVEALEHAAEWPEQPVVEQAPEAARTEEEAETGGEDEVQPVDEAEETPAAEVDSAAGALARSAAVEPAPSGDAISEPARDEAETAAELEQSAGGPAAEAVAEAAIEPSETEEEGVEPARMPVSLTATLRAQGGRVPHRITRRSRRRGRGERTAPEAVEAPAAEIPAQAPAQPVEPGIPEPPIKDRPAQPSIADLLKEGQEIIVQIAKEPLGQKGARITSHIALPGRYVVYMPTVDHLGVSRRISTDQERQRLRRILQKHREGVPGGFIMRTAGEGRSEEEIAADMRHLAALWLDIKQKAEKRRAPALLHHDVEIVQRIIRDQLTEGFKAIWVDSEDLYEQVLHNVERFQPDLLSRVKLYTRPEPIFDAFGITQELEKALRPKVWLKSGGYIVINQTEALVAIDVNTGKFVGKSNRLEDTIVKTNLEAIKEIVRQIRLRDLGGIIVVDFIDMEERKNRQKVMQALEEAMRQDKAPYKILQFNDFGLVAITRKRVKQSLERTLCSPCPTCEGAGYVKSVTTVIGEILTEAAKYAKVVDTPTVVLRVHPDVAKELKSTENDFLEELEEILRRPVVVTPDPLLHPEKFDMA